MWKWTCSVCGNVSTGATEGEAEAEFFTHAREQHNPKTILSFNSEKGE